MLDIPEENMQLFVNFDPGKVYRNPKGIWAISYLYNLIAIPTAFFGIHANVTKFLLPPISIVMVIWLIYLSFGLAKKKASCMLFTGYITTLTSIVSFLAAYKLLSIITDVSPIAIVSAIVAYIAMTVLMIPFTQRLVAKGFYNRPSNSCGAIVVAGVILVTSVVIRSMKGHISQNTAILIAVVILLLLAFLLIFSGVVFFFRYYCFRHMQSQGMKTLANS